MCHLVETIKILDGKPQNLFWHQKRMDKSVKEVFKRKNKFVLKSVISIPANFRSGTVKCRLIYDQSSFNTEFSIYQNRNITTLKMVEDDSINYEHKYFDRKQIENLKDRKDRYDDILIVKNGFITDTSYANILFFDGKNWITSDTPLLKGTCRQRLLYEGKIIEKPLKPDNLKLFNSFMIINAMLDLDENRIVYISNIH